MLVTWFSFALLGYCDRPEGLRPNVKYIMVLSKLVRRKTVLLDLSYLFLERGEGREKERGRNINVREMVSCLSHTPPLGTWPATQACALAGSGTGNLSFHRPALNPLSHTSQGGKHFFLVRKKHIPFSSWVFIYQCAKQKLHFRMSMSVLVFNNRGTFWRFLNR